MEGDEDIINLNYKKGMGCFLFKKQIISGDYSKNVILDEICRLSQQKLCLGLVFRQELLFRRYKRKLTKERQR